VGLMGEYVLDHNTTPDVVRISKVSNILLVVVAE
jgi:hypothetical protein